MGATLVKDMERTSCPDCSASPGKYHMKGCDIERCTECEGQRLSCGCTDHGDYQREKWSGIAYEKAMLIAEENNLYVKWNNGWVKCSKNDEGASHDLNEATFLLMSGKV
jgi:hypothetical protein